MTNELHENELRPQLPGFEQPVSTDRIARYKLLKDLSEGVTRAIQMYVVWALVIYAAKQLGTWPAHLAMHVMAIAIFVYVVETPVLALLEFQKASPGKQIGVYLLGALVAVAIFWGMGIQALMWSDVIVDAINKLTHPTLAAVVAH